MLNALTRIIPKTYHDMVVFRFCTVFLLANFWPEGKAIGTADHCSEAKSIVEELYDYYLFTMDRFNTAMVPSQEWADQYTEEILANHWDDP